MSILKVVFGALAGAPASGTVLLEDTFTSASGEALLSHTPDVGTGWTLDSETDAAGTVRMNVVATSVDTAGRINLGASQNSVYVGYLSTTDPTSADVEIEAEVLAYAAGVDDPFMIIARRQGGGGAYVLYLLETVARLYYRTAMGTATQIGSDYTVTAVAGDFWKLRIVGTSLKAFQNGSEVLSQTDSNIAAAGSAGFGLGDYCVSADDASGNWRIGYFKITEL